VGFSRGHRSEGTRSSSPPCRDVGLPGGVPRQHASFARVWLADWRRKRRGVLGGRSGRRGADLRRVSVWFPGPRAPDCPPRSRVPSGKAAGRVRCAPMEACDGRGSVVIAAARCVHDRFSDAAGQPAPRTRIPWCLPSSGGCQASSGEAPRNAGTILVPQPRWDGQNSVGACAHSWERGAPHLRGRSVGWWLPSCHEGGVSERSAMGNWRGRAQARVAMLQGEIRRGQGCSTGCGGLCPLSLPPAVGRLVSTFVPVAVRGTPRWIARTLLFAWLSATRRPCFLSGCCSGDVVCW